MPKAIQTIREVNSATGLYDMYNELDTIQSNINHGDSVELLYKFNIRVPLLRSYADQINNSMSSRSIGKWDGEASYTTVEEDNHTLRVRFVESSPLFPIVFVIIIGIIVVALIYLILFKVGKVIPNAGEILDELESKYPGITRNLYIAFAALGVGAMIYFISRSGGSGYRPP